jgi:hypothetical protein
VRGLLKMVKPLALFSWLYDAIPGGESICFVCFGVFKTHEISYRDIGARQGSCRLIHAANC